MPEGEKGTKLSYDSVTACFSSAKTDGDRIACKKYFAEQHGKEEKHKTSGGKDETPKRTKAQSLQLKKDARKKKRKSLTYKEAVSEYGQGYMDEVDKAETKHYSKYPEDDEKVRKMKSIIQKSVGR